MFVKYVKKIIVVGVCVVLLSGCSIGRVITGNAGPADCDAVRAYIELCESELNRPGISTKMSGWYRLALVGARLELANSCMGKIVPVVVEGQDNG